MTAILLPTLVAAVLVWLASSVMHMALPHHKSDYVGLPNEDAVADAIRDGGAGPGQYMMPMPSTPGDWNSEDYKQKAAKGPVGLLILAPNGMPNMGKLLALHFVYTLVISFFVGYIAYASLTAGGDYLTTFRVTGAAALIAYSAAHFSNVVWFGYKPSYAFKFALDGVVYALLTAGSFGWLY